MREMPFLFLFMMAALPVCIGLEFVSLRVALITFGGWMMAAAVGIFIEGWRSVNAMFSDVADDGDEAEA